MTHLDAGATLAAATLEKVMKSPMALKDWVADVPARVLRFLMLNSDERKAELVYSEMTEWVAEKR